MEFFRPGRRRWSTGARSVAAACVATALLLVWREPAARAAPQATAEFKRVAIALAKRMSSDQLAKVCKDKRGSDQEVCELVAGSAEAAFEMAIDGKVDEAAINAVLVDLAARLTQAAVADAAQPLVQQIIADLAHETGGACQLTASRGGSRVPVAPADLAGKASACLIARALHGQTSDCAETEQQINSLALVCQAPESDSAGDYKTLLALTQLRRLLSGGTPSGAYDAVTRAAESYELIFAGIDSPNDLSVFDDTELDRVLAAQPDEARCTNLAATRQRLTQWRAERSAVFVGLSRALVTFKALPSALIEKIPVSLPDPACPAGHPLAAARAELEHFAKTYRTDLTLVSRIDPIVLPAFLGAILVDYAQDHNETRLRKQLEDFALRVLARAIAAHDSNSLSCGAASCTEIVASNPAAPPVAVPPGMRPEEVQAVIEDRFSPKAARRTCEYQAVAAAFGRNIELGPLASCRKLGLLGAQDILGTGGAFAALLGPGFASSHGQWLAASLIRVRPGAARLALSGQLDASVAYGNLLLALRGLGREGLDDSSLGSLTSVLEEALRPLLEQGVPNFSRAVLAESARELRPVVARFLDDKLVPLTCADGRDAASLECGVRLLVGAVYDPIIEYISIEDPTEADRRRLATRAYKKALELDPLSRTPLLFNVGPGATGLTRFGGDDSLHLTLLDKFGLAYRWGERNQGELGLFVGGFLDAIIRTATDSPEERQYWLAGATIGQRQFQCVPFGLGVHVAAALPFDLSKTGDRIALAGGLVLTVPADIAFGE